MQIHTSKVTEVTPVQPQLPGRIDNKIWRKRITETVSQSINYKDVFRTASATPGLLNSRKEISRKIKSQYKDSKL